MTWPRALLLALALAGCLSTPPTDDDDAGNAGDRAAPVFAPTLDVGLACRSTCHEPTVAQDGQGRLFVADGAAKEIAVSEDGGRSWSAVAPPPVTTPVPTLQADVLLQAAPSGRLYYSALLLRTLPTGNILLEGIQVAWTEDGGKTWPVNAQVTPLADPTARVAVADRQWLGFGEGETVYLTYNQIPSGIWVGRSTDGGKTWGGWTRAVPTEQRGGSGVGQSGPPVVDAEGRVLVPACVAGTTRTVGVFVSADDGQTFQRRDVDGAAGCSWFPVLSVAPDGEVVAAWHDGRGGIHVSATRDGGETWSEPVQRGRESPTSPWPLALGDGRLALAWFEGSGDAVSLHAARGLVEDTEGTVSLVVADGLDAANTDFAHAILLQDGRLAVVWGDAGAERVRLGVEA